jgi:energy-coupling factor transport system substrate-specific component
VNILRKVSVAFTGLLALSLFTWPLFIQAETQASFAQACFMILMPLLLGLLIVEFTSGQIDTRQLALLGVLTALNAVIRLLGAGVAGIETAFFLIIISAYVFGSSFGFILGSTSILVSALISGGVGPWLPFQMMAAGLIGFGAGQIKRRQFERAWLVAYAVLASLVYGSLMTLWNWPYLAGVGSDVSYLAGAGVFENLRRFFAYELLTGGLVWDLGRAITTSALIVATAPALLATLRRAAGRAGIASKRLRT